MQILAEIQTHRRTGAQAHRRTGAQAHRRTDARTRRHTDAQAHTQHTTHSTQHSTQAQAGHRLATIGVRAAWLLAKEGFCAKKASLVPRP